MQPNESNELSVAEQICEMRDIWPSELIAAQDVIDALLFAAKRCAGMELIAIDELLDYHIKRLEREAAAEAAKRSERRRHRLMAYAALHGIKSALEHERRMPYILDHETAIDRLRRAKHHMIPGAGVFSRLYVHRPAADDPEKMDVSPLVTYRGFDSANANGFIISLDPDFAKIMRKDGKAYKALMSRDPFEPCADLQKVTHRKKEDDNVSAR